MLRSEPSVKSTTTKICLKLFNTFSKGSVVFLALVLLCLHPANAFPEFAQDEGVLIIEKNTGDVLYEQNALEQFYPASTTKLMTALILTETVDDLSDIVTVGDEVNHYGWEASQAGFEEGQQVSYQDLMNGLLLPSGNEAAETIAINVGKILLDDESASSDEAYDAFVEQMNKRAFELGMYDTNFVNPHGLFNENHYSTPRDMMLLGMAAYDVDEIKKTAQTKTYNIKNKDGSTEQLRNTNAMLYDTVGEYHETADQTPNPYKTDLTIAAKTGNTDQSGRTFVFNAEVDDADVYGVIFKTDEEGIFAQTKNVLDDLENNYEFKEIDKVEPVELNNVHFTDNSQINLNELGLTAYLNDDQYEDLEIDYEFDENFVDSDSMELIETVYPDQKIGDMIISSGDRTIRNVPIVVSERMRVKNWTDFIYDHLLLFAVLFIAVLILFYEYLKLRVRKARAKKRRRRKKPRKPRVS